MQFYASAYTVLTIHKDQKSTGKSVDPILLNFTVLYLLLYLFFSIPYVWPSVIPIVFDIKMHLLWEFLCT